jgi:hypothetical protein
MINFKNAWSIVLPAWLALLGPGELHAISKCQDAQGKWHYGDTAHEACGDSTITIIDKSGRTVEEVLPPMTEKERLALQEELARLELEVKIEKEREMERQRILGIYPSVESIERARDDRLMGLDRNIKLQENLLDNFRREIKELKAQKPATKTDKEKLAALIKEKQANVDNYYKTISRLRRERELTSMKYKEILQDYADLTGGTVNAGDEAEKERIKERSQRIQQIKQQLGIVEEESDKKKKRKKRK